MNTLLKREKNFNLICHPWMSVSEGSTSLSLSSLGKRSATHASKKGNYPVDNLIWGAMRHNESKWKTQDELMSELKSTGRGLNAPHFTRFAQSGRSMVEMLGVLAVMGVLSVAGIAGYNTAMNRHRANELLNEASKRAVVVAGQVTMGGRTPSLSEFTNPTGHTFDVKGPDGTKAWASGDNQFTLTITGVSETVCNHMQNMKTALIQKFEPTDCATTATVKLTYNADLSVENSSVPSGGNESAEQTTPACDPACTGGKECVNGTCQCPDDKPYSAYSGDCVSECEIEEPNDCLILDKNICFYKDTFLPDGVALGDYDMIKPMSIKDHVCSCSSGHLFCFDWVGLECGSYACCTGTILGEHNEICCPPGAIGWNSEYNSCDINCNDDEIKYYHGGFGFECIKCTKEKTYCGALYSLNPRECIDSEECCDTGRVIAGTSSNGEPFEDCCESENLADCCPSDAKNCNWRD